MGNPKLTEPLLIWNKVTEMPEMSQVDRVTDAREICTLINAAAQIIIRSISWTKMAIP